MKGEKGELRAEKDGSCCYNIDVRSCCHPPALAKCMYLTIAVMLRYLGRYLRRASMVGMQVLDHRSIIGEIRWIVR